MKITLKNAVVDITTAIKTHRLKFIGEVDLWPVLHTEPPSSKLKFYRKSGRTIFAGQMAKSEFLHVGNIWLKVSSIVAAEIIEEIEEEQEFPNLLEDDCVIVPP